MKVEATMIKHHTDPSMPHSHLPFSPAVQVGNLLFVSGQASVDPTGQIVDDDFEGEMRRAVGNLEAILKHCGSGLDRVVKTQNYLADPKYRDQYNLLYPQLFRQPFPARTTVTKGLSGTLKYEIDCIAVVGEQ
ncbi:RidA family protein [Roseitalea porphyridii]|nr:RidA family protein [Roseitalea porphyridii]